MKAYRDWSPTRFDSKGLALEDLQDWLVCPVSVTRDTENYAVEASNYHTLRKELNTVDPDDQDHQEHMFNHWGPGWFSIILVRPDSECARIADETESFLENYPVLDDSDLSEREAVATDSAWAGLDVEERLRLLHDIRHPDGYLALCDDYPHEADDNGAIADRLLNRY